jgi:hypothetical protein
LGVSVWTFEPLNVSVEVPASNAPAVKRKLPRIVTFESPSWTVPLVCVYEDNVMSKSWV